LYHSFMGLLVKAVPAGGCPRPAHIHVLLAVWLTWQQDVVGTCTAHSLALGAHRSAWLWAPGGPVRAPLAAAGMPRGTAALFSGKG